MVKISKDDVAKLLTDPSGDNRAATARKIAGDFGGGDLTDGERQVAEDIFRLMMKDAEVRVREALSKNLKDSPLVPYDVAVALAKDVDDVALPMLNVSEVLSSEDLIEIIRSQSDATEKHKAIASRPFVPEDVSDALVDTMDEDVVASLVVNNGAEISERSFHKVIDRFGASEKIQEPMISRQKKLPLTISERLVTLVSDRLRDQLVARDHLPESMVRIIMTTSRESALVGMLGPDVKDRDLDKLITQLAEEGRLSASIVLRALCMGDLAFFEAGLARRAAVSLNGARVLVYDSGPLGLQAIYNKADMPPQFYPGVDAAITVSRETGLDGGEKDRERYSRRMIERILTQYGDLGVELDSDDVDYLMGRMLQLPAEESNDR